MAGGQTPPEQDPDHPGVPETGAPESGATQASTGKTARKSARAKPAAAAAPQANGSTSAAASAAVSAMSAAIAATAAAKSAAKETATPPAAPAANPATNAAAPAAPPLVVQGYVRPPGRDVPGLIRAHHDEPEEAAAAPVAPLPQPPVVAADPNSRYMRPSGHYVPGVTRAQIVESEPPEVPGIIRAHHEETELPEGEAKPAPLFSNEGIVRQSQARRRSRVAGFVGGIFDEFIDAGTALGHSLGSHFPGSKTAIASPGLSTRQAPPTHRRRAVVILAGIASIAVLVVALTAAVLPGEYYNGFPSNPSGPPDNPQDNLNGGSADPAAQRSGQLVGDDSLPPGATRRPGGVAAVASPTPAGSLCWVTPTAGPTATSSGPTSSSSASLTPKPLPTPVLTACPTPVKTGVPTPTVAGTPTTVPSPTAVPTPTPTPEMFAYIYSITPPAVSPGNGEFLVSSLPGASCQLWRRATPADPFVRRSAAFTIASSGQWIGWYDALWGATAWPASVASVTLTFYATCTAAAPDGRTAQSDDATAFWPAHATTPPATPTPAPPAT